MKTFIFIPFSFSLYYINCLLPFINIILENGSVNSTKLATTAYVKAVVAKKALHISIPSFNSFPKDISNSNITTTMRVVNIEWGTPSSITSKVGWNTNTAGHLVLSGTITSTGTTAEIDLIDFG